MEANKDIFESPSGKILRYILERGEATIKDIEDAIQVTRNAVRIQIDHLVSQELLGSRLEKKERGRPERVYYVTDKGRFSLPNHYKDLAKSLWEEVSKITDSKKKEEVLNTISSKLADDYKNKISEGTVKERLGRFVAELNKEGIPSELSENKDGYVWNEFNCPYYEVAKEYSDICAIELEMMGKLLGSPVERSEWLLDGAAGCQFKMRKVIK